MWRDTGLTEQVEKRQNTLFHIFFHTLSHVGEQYLSKRKVQRYCDVQNIPKGKSPLLGFEIYPNDKVQFPC